MKRFPLLLALLMMTACEQHQAEDNVVHTEQPSLHQTLPKIDNIQHDYETALSLATEQNKSVFMLVESENCRWCQKLKATTLQDETMIERLNREFVVLLIDRDRDRYPSNFEVKGVPMVFMLDAQGSIYTSLVGYRSDPREYTKWFDYIQIERE
ncbi:MAG: thioredoxin family protein [Campylobacterales bacterium]|nr:thioredoxin family protein [Campylobacterales bacterium]